MPNEAERHLRERLNRLRGLPLLRGTRLSGELERLQRQLERIEAEPSDEEIWRSVDLARHSQRPYTLDYVERLFEDFVELHGDRARAEDPRARDRARPVRGQHGRGHRPAEGTRHRRATRRNFGMAHPEGYRKGMRMMEIAQRHGFPLVTFLDSPGAYPGVAAEQHGQGGAIARSQALMARLTVPLVACIIGEGNSGGAIAIGLVDRVLMQENAMYSVISPEGCAAILWRDGAEKGKAAVALKPDAVHCLELGVIDEIVKEPQGGAHLNPDESAGCSARRSAGPSTSWQIPGEELRAERRDRYRRLGIFTARGRPLSSPVPRVFHRPGRDIHRSTVFSPASPRRVGAD